MEQSLLLEVLANGRPSRLELATTAGMLTLHPEPDEPSIHGNVVRPDGVRPLAFPWSPQHEFVVVDQPISALVTVHGLASRVTPGSSVTLPVLIVDGHLEVTERSRTFLREGPDRWRLNGLGDGPDEPVIVGESGLPGLDGCAAEWPIEAPAEG